MFLSLLSTLSNGKNFESTLKILKKMMGVPPTEPEWGVFMVLISQKMTFLFGCVAGGGVCIGGRIRPLGHFRWQVSFFDFEKGRHF